MKADTLTPTVLFQKQVRYEIPPFQRPYVWNHHTQWAPLWEDIRDAAEDYLDRGSDKPHFMGAVVLQQCPTTAGELETRIVVDGQQRLTTIQLLLDAVQEVFDRRGHELPARRLSLLVVNDEVFWRDDADRAYKIWPTIADRDAFRHAMHNDLPSAEHDTSLVVQAHDFFKDQVDLWLDEIPAQSGRPDALEKVVSQLLELVVIDIGLTDDPNVIFETLNARGTPLLQSDLIKNLILHEADIGTHSKPEEIARIWCFDDRWWRDDVRQGRLLRPRVDVFLNYWMVTRKREQVAPDKVFSVFSSYAETTGASIGSIAEDVRRASAIYSNLENDRYPEFATFLYRQRVMQVGVLTPVLLWLFSSDVPRSQVARGLHALDSYLVRRMICRMTAKDYNDLFIGLLDHLERRGTTSAGDAVVDYLAQQEADAREWPDDRTLKEHFVTAPVYRLLTRGRLRLVLEGIEGELRTDKAESQSVPRDLTVEHIMPQQWRANWALPNGTEDAAELGHNRDRIVHSIGNLTLVNQRLNSTLSNAPWREKQQTLNGHSVLFLNKTLLADAPPVWDEETIAARADQLCQAAINVWPHADRI